MSVSEQERPDHVPIESELIFDWDTKGQGYPPRARGIALVDETLRDGLQSPSAHDPELDVKRRMLHLMDRLGVDAANLGLPAASPRAREDIVSLCREISSAHLRVTPQCAVRTVEDDIALAADLAQRSGMAIETCIFVGSSGIRQFVEGWTLTDILTLTERCVSLAVRNGLPVMFVMEDTCRAAPDAVRQLYASAIAAGASHVCICDTVGSVTPPGVRNVVGLVREVVAETNPSVQIDWHGHNDRGLALINTLEAVISGVDRVHATGLGVGERVGNCQMEQLLVNLRLMGYIATDLRPLADYVAAVSDGLEVSIPSNYPVFGEDAFRTATGVHAAAVIKARARGCDWLADRVYSGVPASMVGKQQRIEIGFMSGQSNVREWLTRHGIPEDERLVQRLMAAAKNGRAVLTDDELTRACDEPE